MLDIVGEIGSIIGADPDVATLMRGDGHAIQRQFLNRSLAFQSALHRLQALGGGAPHIRPDIGMDPVVMQRLQAALANNIPIATEEKSISMAAEVPFGFGPFTVAPNATQTVTLTPGVPYKPNRFSIPQAIAQSFVMSVFQIGQTSLLINGNQVPCEAFSDLAYNPRGWKLPTIQLGQPASLAFINVSGVDQVLRGNFWGVFVQ